ncbi:choice-of-anchor J domain-containing protein [Aquimarina sp. U1-2]|uniref:DUF5689 domain-containing protein n=1 Tax=Aquimarina sp. U1-2 TaxID=2823141 RepID=UPI001AECB6D8|nr:DUF5689 domain-containing protein [Aquimarina sp. U1-2]MBP2831115.1 choice-of-anchor J domain-containing protein [Aquimarina sp. U1-2]
MNVFLRNVNDLRASSRGIICSKHFFNYQASLGILYALAEPIKTVLYGVICVISILSCAPEEDFAVPPLIIEEPSINGTVIDLGAVLGTMYQEIEREGQQAKATFKNTDTYFIGYVVSSDKGGNFFKELILQNNTINPTAGIRLLIDNSPLYTSYEFGRKLYVKLDGLSVGLQNGVPTLGFLDGNTIAAIASFSVADVVHRSPEVHTITPLDTTIENFNDQLLNLYIRLYQLQFHKNMVLDQNVFTLAAEPNDVFDGERILEDCTTRRSTILSTSTFADFKGVTLPRSQGSFTGILTKNFVGDTYNLVLNDPNGLIFDIDDRCDPLVLSCPVGEEGSTIIFKEDFTAVKTKDLEKLGWLNQNLSGGKLDYEIGDFAENQYIQITGFRSKEPIYEVWLLSPEIDLTNSVDPILNFDVQAGYDNGNILEVFVTNDFEGDIKTATWVKLDTHLPRGPMNAFGDSLPAGPIGLSCAQGSIRIGFRYIGGDPKATTRYHIDNIIIKSR